MKHPPMSLALGDGWECLINLQYHHDGACSARADVLCLGRSRCVLVALNVAGPDEALQRLTQRANDFVNRSVCPSDDSD